MSYRFTKGHDPLPEQAVLAWSMGSKDRRLRIAHGHRAEGMGQRVRNRRSEVKRPILDLRLKIVD
jgi:hypothetical protein